MFVVTFMVSLIKGIIEIIVDFSLKILLFSTLTGIIACLVLFFTNALLGNVLSSLSYLIAMIVFVYVNKAVQ